VVTVRTDGVTWSEKELVADAAALSVNRILKVNDPIAVGVPDRTPRTRLSPDGSDPPAKDQVYGGDPPAALRPCEYGVPTGAVGKDEVVMLRTGSLIDSERATVANAARLSTTRRVKLDEPAATGVPLMTPPEKLNPAGSDPLATDQV
jgi:hypothetical protein